MSRYWGGRRIWHVQLFPGSQNVWLSHLSILCSAYWEGEKAGNMVLLGLHCGSYQQDWVFLNLNRDWDFFFILDIETIITNFRIAVLIFRLVFRLSELQFWYWNWYWDYKDPRLDIKTGIETFRIAVLILRLV